MFKILTSRAKPSRVQTRNLTTNLSDADQWFYDIVAPNAGEGVSVNHRSALGIPAYYASLKKRGGTIGSLTFEIFEKTENGVQPAIDHPLYNLVRFRPHPLYNAFIFWQTVVTNMDNRGESYVRIIRGGNARPIRFDIIQKEDVRDLVDVEGQYFYIINERKPGRLTYVQKPIPIDDIIHLKGMTFDGVNGIDPIATQKQTFSSGISARKYTAAFYSNNAHVSFAVETPAKMSSTARDAFSSWWRRSLSSIKNAFKNPIILDSGSKLHQISLNPQEAQLNESNKSIAEDAARINDVPAHMVGLLDKATFSNIEVQNNEFLMFSIRNTLKQIELEFGNKIFTTEETNSRRFFLRANLDSLLRSDVETRAKKIESEVKWGIIDRDEARHHLGYSKEPERNWVMVPMNMNLYDEDGKPNNAHNQKSPMEPTKITDNEPEPAES